jgi:DNA-binding NarL/FixJ family response regulator
MSPGEASPASDEQPTTRELEILRCAADGLTIPKTAEKLEVAEETVKFHRGNLFLEARRHGHAPHAVAISFRTRLLESAGGQPRKVIIDGVGYVPRRP